MESEKFQKRANHMLRTMILKFANMLYKTDTETKYICTVSVKVKTTTELFRRGYNNSIFLINMTSKALCILFLGIVALNVLLPEKTLTANATGCDEPDAAHCAGYASFCNDPVFASTIASCPHICGNCGSK